MNTRIIAGLALGCLVAATPSWAAPGSSRRGGGKTLVKGASNRAKKAAPKPAPKPAPRFPVNALPSLQQAAERLAADKSPGLKAMPFSMDIMVEKGVLYHYNFLNINGEGAYLIYADDRVLITSGQISGNRAVDNTAVHVWSARDYSYQFSILVNGCGLGVAPDICVDPQNLRFVIGIYPSRYTGNGGLIGYDPMSGVFEVLKIDAEMFYQDAEMTQPCFAALKKIDFNGLKVPMDNIIELQRVPLLNGLVHHFDCEGENTIRRVDFNTLRMRPQERILHASEVKLSDLEGLPELTSSESYSTEVKDDGSYGTLMIFPKSCEGLCDAAWKKQDDESLPLMAFDPVSKSLFHDSNAAWCDIRYNPYYKKTEIGRVVHNGIHGGRGMPSWAGPSLLNPETGKLTGIAFANGNDSEFEIQPEYRIQDSLAGWESLGSSLCVWAPVPGDETKSYWLAGGENVCALILIDETTKTGRVVQSWNGEWGRSYLAKNVPNPVWLPDKQWLCLPTQENCWAVIEIKDFTQPGEEKYSICTGAGGAWALILPDGRYTGSPGCEKLLLGATGENTWVPMTMLAPWRNRPAEVLEAIGGNPDDVAALRETTRRWLAKMNLNPDAMPPESSIDNHPRFSGSVPAPMCDGSETTIEMELMAQPNKAAAGVEVRVNGAEVLQDWSSALVLPAGRKLPLSIRIPLNRGQNNVTLTAVDTMGGKSREINTRFVRPGNAESRLFVVTLGVSDYDDDALDLQFAAKDARDMAAAFSEHGSGEVKVLTLTDKEVADKKVLDRVKEFLAESTIEDRVVFYLAGHGMLDDKLEYHYAPAAFDAERVAATGISMDDLVRCLQNAPARERLLLLDTCHSGQLGEAGEEKLAEAGVQLPHGVRAIQTRGMKVKKATGALTSTVQQKRYIEDMFSLDPQYRGVSIVAGAAGAEFALESGEWNNGVFTASVMQTLADFATADVNRDGVLSVTELLPAIQAKVQQLTGGAQMPNIVAAESSYMVIASGVGADLIGDNWASLTKRIRKAANAEEALLLFDRIMAYRAGLSYVSTWEQAAAKFEAAGRAYDAEKLAVLKSDFALQHPKNAEEDNYNASRVPTELWQAVLDKGVAPDALMPWFLEAEARGELLEAMMKAGMSPEGTGDTPLLFEYRSLDVLKVLLAAGVDPNLRNKDGKTRMQELADSIIDLSADDLEQILVLLQHGASTEGIGEQSKRYSDFCDVQKLHRALATATPAPELPEGKAPATLGDSVLLLTYEGAESSTRSYEEEDAEPTPFEPYANSAPQTILAMPDHEQGTVRHYRRTGADTAEVKVYSVFPGCQLGKLVARYADRLTADLVCECVSAYMGDGVQELQLTFDSPTTATAQELQGASCEETVIRNVKVTLQPADFRLPEAH